MEANYLAAPSTSSLPWRILESTSAAHHRPAYPITAF
jgi:hypothetical protein